MSDLPKRLRASLRYDAINGDSFERSVCAKQMREAADSLERADARIAELEQSVTVRDTEIARLENDLELARMDGDRYRWLRDNPQHPNHSWFCDHTEKWHAPFEVAPALAVHVPFESLETAIDAARAGNGSDE